uniref:Uncharacterized protein n=1 Tax=Romanomermis culicivorax TaxID=13658 RepID=A0A915JFN9_ROMCU
MPGAQIARSRARRASRSTAMSMLAKQRAENNDRVPYSGPSRSGAYCKCAYIKFNQIALSVIGWWWEDEHIVKCLTS